jgi:hypothetical protein
MKRLAIVLAAILPVTGCFSGTCHPTVTVDWPSFLLADGSTTGCGGAGVSTIDVWVNNSLAGSFACNGPPAAVHAAGADVITVEARDSTNVIRYRDWFTVGSDGCGNLGTANAQPAEGTVDVNYTFSPTNACYSPGPSFVWVYVHDDIANEIAADSSAAPEVGDVCGVNAPLTFRLPVGDYTLAHAHEMIRGGGGTYAVVGRDCNARGFSVTNPPTTHATVSPVLVDASATCP